jgi:hypothetical protein
MAFIGVLLALQVALSLQFTHYANENATAVVASVAPCHLYGDSDSYGIGVRSVSKKYSRYSYYS